MNKHDARNDNVRILPGIAALLVATGAIGADRFWTNPGDGAFGDPLNWDDGKQAIPGVDDAAIFDQPSLFDVTFDADYMTDRMLVRSGRVTFTAESGAFEYRLLNPFSTSPGITVGVGDGDTADLTLRGGRLSADFVDLGDEADAFGALTVSGGASDIIADAQLNVGNEGIGVLDVIDLGIVASGAMNVGQLGGSLGQVTVSDPGSTLLIDGATSIARFGVGDLVIERGGHVLSGDATVGQEPSSQGSVIVRDDSRWIVDGTLDVGMGGFGSLVVENGGRLENHTFATIGTFPGDPEQPPFTWGIGEVIVSGAGSSWLIDGDLLVPFLAEGTLDARAGGTVLVGGDLVLGLDDDFGDRPLIFTLAGPDDYPEAAIDVTGVVCPDSELPRARVALEYDPEAGDTFVLLTAADGAALIDLDLPVISASLDWEVTHTEELIQITVETSCRADFDEDGKVGFQDLVRLLAAWGDENVPEDLNGSGFVDFPDIVLLLAAWGPCP